MKPIRRILFAVKDPSARHQSGMDKAITFARRVGASLELFHSISTPVFLEIQPYTGTSLGEAKREALKQREHRLQQLAARGRGQDVTTTCAVEWDFPPHEAIVRRAMHTGADLIIAECHKGYRTAPWLIHLTDWELVRTSHVPVLLIKNAQAWRERPIVLAAVDPSHARAKPARLDAQIVAEAERCVDDFSGSLHLMHANFPTMFGITPVDPITDGSLLATSLAEAMAQRQRAFHTFAKDHSIPRTRRHIVEDDPAHAIPAVARELAADVVVMGALARSGLKRVFIGNTAERVLSALPCDVLVVKPARYRKHIALKSRGMRVIAPPPVFPMTA